jgi:hypothetical protein
MADVNVQEVGTYPAQHIIDDYFTDVPSDFRYTCVEYRCFVSQTSIDSNSGEITFILPPQNAPYCYQLSDTLMKVRLQIVKKGTNQLPNPDAKIGPVNNVIGSLFEKMTLKINDELVTTVPELYAYKCYLKRLLTFNEDVKATNFKPSGYVSDSCIIGYFLPTFKIS